MGLSRRLRLESRLGSCLLCRVQKLNRKERQEIPQRTQRRAFSTLRTLRLRLSLNPGKAICTGTRLDQPFYLPVFQVEHCHFSVSGAGDVSHVWTHENLDGV